MAEKHALFVAYKIKGKIEALVADDFLQAIKERTSKTFVPSGRIATNSVKRLVTE